MGQLVLGFRSLFVKIAVFVVFAALLAWILGGTLWPKPHFVDSAAVSFDGGQWFWRQVIQGDRRQPAAVHWRLMAYDGEMEEAKPFDDSIWHERSGQPLAVRGSLYYACRADDVDNGRWRIIQVGADDATHVHPMPDAFAVDVQMMRLANGLSLADPKTIAIHQRELLEPDAVPADAGN